jgi:dipeptidyl aminopeptidase/acylaminoacyl peptidase
MLMEWPGGTNLDIGALSMEGDHTRRPLLQEEYLESQPQISPDGRWMAYACNESGQNQVEVYVRPFPEVNKHKWQVSAGGGESPLWSPDGKELFYLNLSGDAVMGVAIETESEFKAGKPEVLFRGKIFNSTQNDPHTWDISPDGNRFLMMKEFGAEEHTIEAPRKIIVVTNWFEELKERVPLK